MDSQTKQARETKLRKLRALARLLDEAITVPGTRIRLGLDSLVGLVPGVGDAATAVFSGYIIREAARLGLPQDLLLRMVANVALDLVVGAVPVAGDLFDVAWKANKKNIKLLEEWLKSEDLRSESYIDV